MVLILERQQTESNGSIILKFFLAPIVLFLGIALLYLFLQFDIFLKIGGFMIAYFFPPLGKESVIPMAVAVGLNPILVALSVALLDIIAALFLLWNYDFVKIAPYLGPWMDRFEKRNTNISQKRIWIKGLEFIGVILFVMFPFQGSGGVGGTIVGRLFGLNKYIVFLGICIGSLASCFIIAFTADRIRTLLFNNLVGGIILIIIILFFIVIYIISKKYKKM
jgi:uncharacterized membrane protein